MSTGLNNFTLDDDEEGQVELSQPASVPTAANASSPAAAAEAASPSPTPAPQQPQQVSTSSGRESPAIALNAFAHPPANSSMLQRSDTSLARSAAAEISSKKAIETAQQIRSLTPTTSILTVKFIGPPGEAVDPELGLKSLAHAIQLLHENCDRIEEAEATLQVGCEPDTRPLPCLLTHGTSVLLRCNSYFHTTTGCGTYSGRTHENFSRPRTQAPSTWDGMPLRSLVQHLCPDAAHRRPLSDVWP